MVKIVGAAMSGNKLLIVVIVLALAAAGSIAVKQITSATATPIDAPQTVTHPKAQDSPVTQPTTVLPQSASSEASDITSSASTTNTSTTLNVNGQDVPIPKNGSVSKTVVSDDGNAQVNVQSRQHTSADSQGSNHSYTSVDISIDSNSSVEKEGL